MVSLVAAGLTFFSGFGLGTLLLPAFAVFFSIELAVAATAIVHLANNLFKLAFVARHAVWKVVLAFGVPAALLAFAGSMLLREVAGVEPLHVYSLAGYECTVTAAKLMIAVLMTAFALIEILPRFQKLSFDPKLLPLGGALSGFFGGLSGHQGALRTAFLLRSGLSKEAFVGSSAACSIIVDVSRLAIYGSAFFSSHLEAVGETGVERFVVIGVIAAFVGTFVGSRVLHKVTYKKVHEIVAVMLFCMAFALAIGVL